MYAFNSLWKHTVKRFEKGGQSAKSRYNLNEDIWFAWRLICLYVIGWSLWFVEFSLSLSLSLSRADCLYLVWNTQEMIHSSNPYTHIRFCPPWCVNYFTQGTSFSAQTKCVFTVCTKVIQTKHSYNILKLKKLLKKRYPNTISVY